MINYDIKEIYQLHSLAINSPTYHKLFKFLFLIMVVVVRDERLVKEKREKEHVRTAIAKRKKTIETFQELPQILSFSENRKKVGRMSDINKTVINNQTDPSTTNQSVNQLTHHQFLSYFLNFLGNIRTFSSLRFIV